MSKFDTFALWAQEVRNLIFKKAATCSHLPVTASGCKWLLVAAGQVAASGCGASDCKGCKWRQVAACGCGPSGCKWLLVAACGLRGKWLQVAASGCLWLLVAAGQVAASGCGASDCKWRQVAASGCGPSGCLWLKVAASRCKSLLVAAGQVAFFSRLESASCQVPRNDGILRDNS